MTKKAIIPVNLAIIFLMVIFDSCCPFVNTENLGHGFVLSEYDQADRRIIYSKDRCSGSGTEVVPMTVLEYASDTRWIVARSSKSRDTTDCAYWIIDKNVAISTCDDSTLNKIKSCVFGPLDSATHVSSLNTQHIHLKLNKF